jgi:hypothetical protein
MILKLTESAASVTKIGSLNAGFIILSLSGRISLLPALIIMSDALPLLS